MQGLIGQDLGGYRIVSQIGKGGMATVFKAFQPSLDRYVAVKVMPPYYPEQDDTFLKRFRQEAKAIASLRHPNILIVIDYGEEKDTTYIVMEFVEAGTLSELLGKPMIPAQMRTLVDQVAGALQYAHDKGVVHRDIKPSNILLPKPDWPLLTDFGLAKIVGGSQLTQSGTVAGTPAYMSPEQGRGEKVDSRSDIYSLGIVLYEMATGVVPFHAETPMAVVVKHIIDPLPLPRSKNPELPETIERVILKALSKDPADRFQEAGEMGKALDEAVAGLPTGVAEAVPAVPAAQVTTLVDEADVSAQAEKPAQGVAERAAEVEAAPSASSGFFSGKRRIAAAAIGGLLLLAAVSVGVAQILNGSSQDASQTDAGEQATLEEVGPVLEELVSIADEIGQAIEQDPENIDLYFERAFAYAEAGQFDRAYDSVQEGINVMPAEGWVHEYAGDTLWEMGNFEEAVAEFRIALEIEPQSYWVYYYIAEIYAQTGRPDEAGAVLFEALENPDLAGDPDELDSIGWFFLSLGMVNEAEEAFNRALGTDPENPARFEGLAEVAYQRGGAPAGIEMALAGIERFPDHGPFYEFAGSWYWELGDLEQAVEALKRSIELTPANASALGSLAGLLNELGRGEEAKQLIQGGLEQNPNDAGIIGVAADFYMGRDEPGEAIPLLERAIELEPEEGWFYANLARALAIEGDGDRAHLMIEEASARNPDDPWLDEYIGWIYFDTGSCEQAINYFERAVSIDPSIESAYEGIGRCGS